MMDLKWKETLTGSGYRTIGKRGTAASCWGLPPGSVLSTSSFESTCQTRQQISIAEGFGQACVKYCISQFYCIKDPTEWLVKCILILFASMKNGCQCSIQSMMNTFPDPH